MLKNVVMSYAGGFNGFSAPTLCEGPLSNEQSLQDGRKLLFV